jgi:hypothetical protein
VLAVRQAFQPDLEFLNAAGIEQHPVKADLLGTGLGKFTGFPATTTFAIPNYHDVLLGGQGNTNPNDTDTIAGGSGSDWIFGGDCNNWLSAGPHGNAGSAAIGASDLIFGGSGENTFQLVPDFVSCESTVSDVFYGNGGNNRVVFIAADALGTSVVDAPNAVAIRYRPLNPEDQIPSDVSPTLIGSIAQYGADGNKRCGHGHGPRLLYFDTHPRRQRAAERTAHRLDQSRDHHHPRINSRAEGPPSLW